MQGIIVTRALAACAIMFFHVTEFLKAQGVEGEWHFRLAGFGLHMFLLITGFLALREDRPGQSPLDYFLRRAVRIIPLYWLTTLAAIGLTLGRDWLFPRADIDPESIAASLFFAPSYDLAGVIQPILFVGWTLNYIMVFNIIAAASRALPQQLRGVYIIACVILVFLAARTFGSGAIRDFFGDTLMLEFAIGCAIAMLLNTAAAQRIVRRLSLPAICALAVVTPIVGLELRDRFGLDAGIAYGAPAALIFLAAILTGRSAGVARDSALGWIADRSFGIYLIHPLMIAIIGPVLHGLGLPPLVLGGLLVVVTLVASFLAADLSLRFFEKPAADWLMRILRPSGDHSSNDNAPPARA
jgi:exopolysaccharide production protein ExoZ